MKGIIDDDELDGVVDLRTALRPHRVAELLPVGNVATFYRRVSLNCEAWGGGGTVLIPSISEEIPEPFERLLVASDVDRLESAFDGTDFTAPQWLSNGMGRRHPALAVAQGIRDRENWLSFRVADLKDSDPWKPIYAATLGVWPSAPSVEMFPGYLYNNPPESFEQFFKVERADVVGSLRDLVERLVGANRNTARSLSTVSLAFGLLPDTSLFGGKSIFPAPNALRRAAGPNIVVVFGTDPVADGSLLWNLRGAHTSRYALPIGVPRAELDVAALRMLGEPGNAAMFGLSGGAVYLTSTSVPAEELEALAAMGPGTQVADWRDLLSLGPAPAIHHVQVAMFADGVARVVPLTDDDQKVVFPYGRMDVTPSLQIEVSADRMPVAISKTLRGRGFDPFYFAANSAQIQVPSSNRQGRTVEVKWPTAWLQLQCAAKDRCLEIEPSVAGHAGVALLKAIGGIDQLYWLCHPGLVALLYRLAERSGMAWWKQRWSHAKRELALLGVDQVDIEAAAGRAGRDDFAIALPGEGRELRFQEFVNALGGKARAAEHWIAWAEQRHLIVRGVEVKCRACSTSSWLPMAALPNEVACSGCGRIIDQPFPARSLDFQYRIGEVLRRVLELDCLDHLFALRYLNSLLGPRGVIGIHPGINFRERGSKSVLAEADVLLLLADGSMIPGEVKRTGAGVTPSELEKLDGLASRLGSPWSFVSVGQAAHECGENVRDAQRREETSPRFVLTTDQTFTSRPIMTMGADPFEWSPKTADEVDQRSERFVAGLRDRSPGETWNLHEAMFLSGDD